MSSLAAAGAVLATLVLAASVKAQNSQPAAPRDTSQKDTTVYKLSPLEVHASIIPSAGPRIGSGVPARVSTLSRQQIEGREPRILPDVLATQPGVSVYDDLGTPFKLNISTRGFTAGPTIGLPPGITVFLDGVRQNEADAQEVNFDLLPMEHIKRVELLSGTASLLGPNSLGGAINLITDRGEGPPHGELEATGGTYGAYSGQASFSGLSRGWDYYLSGGQDAEDGWRQDTGGKERNAFLSLGHMADARGIRLQAFVNTARVREAGSLPESLFRLDPRRDFTPGDWDHLATRQLALSGYAPAGAGVASFTAYVRAFTGDRFNVNQAPDPSALGHTEDRTYGLSADWRWARELGPSTLAFRAGVDGTRNAVNVHLYDVPAGLAPGVADSLTTNVESPSYDLAGYALADLRAGRFTFSGGARWDVVGVPFHDLLDPTGNASHSFRHLSPRAGVNADFGPASVYASVGASFRAPAVLELGCADPNATCPLPFALGDDPALKPVLATTYEVGGRFGHGKVRLDGSAYLSDVRDEIFFISSPQSIMSGYFTNLPRTRRAGVELSAQGDAGHFSWYANYAYTRATFESAIAIFSQRSESSFLGSALFGDNAVRAGDRLPLVPAHQLKAGVDARLVGPVTAGLDGRYIGRQWLRGDEANQTTPLDPYAVFDGRLGAELGGWELSVVADNLFDSTPAVFGTFNANRATGQLERFLTPLNARTLKLVLRRQLGGGHYRDAD